jgi:hypothetical protein
MLENTVYGRTQVATPARTRHRNCIKTVNEEVQGNVIWKLSGRVKDLLPQRA